MDHSLLAHMTYWVQSVSEEHNMYPTGTSLIKVVIDPLPKEWTVQDTIYSTSPFSGVRKVAGIVFANQQGEVVVAFRGSKGFAEWMHNLSILCVGYEDLFNTMNTDTLPIGRILAITGSSAGGAMACMYAAKHNIEAEVVTFGSPVRWHAKGIHYRVPTDPVTYLGPLFHPAGSLPVGKSEWLSPFTHWLQWCPPFFGHFAGGYFKGVAAPDTQTPLRISVHASWPYSKNKGK